MADDREQRGSTILLVPRATIRPTVAIVRRVVIALAVLAAVTLVVYLGRDGYRDAAGGSLSLLDAAYYTTVSLSTTGYGDIAPVSPTARAVNILLVTPARVLFLIVLVGTTLEVLTERSREAFRAQQWRRRVRDHVVVVGFGTKGRSAVRVLREDNVAVADIVVVDPDPVALRDASREGLVTVVGAATRTGVLREARVDRARAVIVATDTDEANVLVTLTARELAPGAFIVASAREAENVHLLRRSGADDVVTSSEAAGRLLGLSTHSPRLVAVIEDLLIAGTGLNLIERAPRPGEVGRHPRECDDPVLAIERDGRLLGYADDDAAPLQSSDQLIVVQQGGGGVRAVDADQPPAASWHGPPTTGPG